MSDINLLYLIEPIVPLIPRVQKPIYPIKLTQKILWTSLVLFIFLFCSQIPLYGIHKTKSSDPLHWIRVISASNKGTLMELGMTPIFAASFLIKALMHIRLLKVDQLLTSERFLIGQFHKIFSLLISVAWSLSLVLRGNYGTIEELGLQNIIIIFLELLGASVLVIVLEELLESGYGLGSGMQIFLAINIAERIMWQCLSPYTISKGKNVEYEGVLVALIHFLITKPFSRAIYLSFFRSSTNIMNLIFTFFIFFLSIYIQKIYFPLNLISRNIPGTRHKFKIELIYCSGTPVILLSGILTKLYMLSQILFISNKKGLLIDLLGKWEIINGKPTPIGGLAYYIFPVNKFKDIIDNPLRSLIYIIFVVIFSAIGASLYTKLNEEDGISIAKHLREAGFFIEKIDEINIDKNIQNKDNVNNDKNNIYNESPYKLLKKYVPIASALGGACIGLLQIFSNLTGVIGSGTGILLLVNYILLFRKELMKGEEESMIKTLYKG